MTHFVAHAHATFQTNIKLTDEFIVNRSKFTIFEM